MIRVELWRRHKGARLWRVRCLHFLHVGKVLTKTARTPGQAADIGRRHLHNAHGWR